ncbi:MerR family transcriptional regulator [Streptomyces cyaneofuscatus]|uniref:MerR family transcriptional regulator n=1 Tax=Streptomyces cyaneofuscatus TaxID=66883 RepID=UPI0029550D19|nr:MerR family transcriptional regulator [Streptomyces cyaneofuscatus]WOP10599.1 MerR family transcriptional regulator [Streptomyces cyaneofuscatus]
MLIGELSRRTGVHAHLLRYYESQGLLRPTRSPGGYREYTDDVVLTVTQIRNLLAAGLSTQEIAYTLPCATGPSPELEPCAEVLDVLRARLRGIDARIDALLDTRRSLGDYIEATERRRRATDASDGPPACEPRPAPPGSRIPS